MILPRIFIAVFVAVLLSCQANAQISKGHQILINRGLQVHGMVVNDLPFHLSTYTNANYSAVHWQWASSPELMGPPPGVPWVKWAADEVQMPPQTGEAPYLSELFMIQLGDEWELNNDTLRTRLVDWFVAERSNWPNAILFHNNFGGQVNDAQLGDFISRAQPDLLCFDSYPFRYDTGTGTSFSTIYNWYGDLRRYREHARDNNLPLGVYLQTFASDGENVRAPSSSEMRLQHSAALAFNAKLLIDFTYNNGASSLFNNPSTDGDNYPNASYYEKADCALRARNLGKALVRLKPLEDDTYFPDGRTTAIALLRGRDGNGQATPIPIGFQADFEDGSNYTEWAPGRNDPYLIDWIVTNVGTKNNGHRGDVFLSWFKPLDESFDGPHSTNEVYMMVVNALSDMTGSAADCAQQIKLNFNNSLAAVELMNPITGLVEWQPLIATNGIRQLLLNLNGGDAALFKFASGAPFVGADTSPSLLMHEPFNYSNIGAPVSSNTPANWLGGGSGTNDTMVAPGNLSYPGLGASVGNSITNGGVGLGVRRLFGTRVSSGALYFSALFKMTDFGTWTVGNMPAQVGALTTISNTVFRLQVMVRSNTPSTYLLGLQKGGTGATNVMDTTPLNLGDTVFLVGKYDFTTTPNVVSLWINPSSSGLGAASEAPTGLITNVSGIDFNGINVIDRFNFRQNTAASVPAVVQWDELRVGRSWADVTPVPLPPRVTSVALLPNGNLRLQALGSPGSLILETSVDFSEWSHVTTLFSETGNFEHSITSPSDAQRYYRLKRE